MVKIRNPKLLSYYSKQRVLLLWVFAIAVGNLASQKSRLRRG